jgi:hypothetical protein
LGLSTVSGKIAIFQYWIISGMMRRARSGEEMRKGGERVV